MSEMPRFDDLLSRWEDLCRRGHPDPDSEVFRDCPTKLLPRLREWVEAQRAMRQWLGNTVGPQSSPATLRPAADAAEAAPNVAGYKVLGLLGKGGMGVVYLAEQVRLGRLVALKIVRRGGQAGTEEWARFQLEAEAAGRLRHPNVVQVYDVGEHDGRPFLVMEYCSGGSLRDRLAAGPLAPATAAALVEALAGGVELAHRRHLLHRDLKPANVLFAEDGTPKLADFGLVKVLDQPGLTATGLVMGTPSYMAPEQVRPELSPVTPASDVYALGAVLFECLTGRPPFQAATTLETFHQVVHTDPVPVRRLQPGTPRDLETVCLKCLHKEPRKRYSRAALLAEDLRRVREGQPVRARGVSLAEKGWRWARRHPAAAALGGVLAAALLLLAFGGQWLLIEGERRASAERERRTAAYLAGLNEVRHRLLRGGVGWRGRCLDTLRTVAALDTAGRDPVELRTEAAACLGGVDVSEEAVLVQDFWAAALAFRPDGKLLAVAEHRVARHPDRRLVLLIDVESREEVRTLAFPALPCQKDGEPDSDGASSVAFSPSGRWLVVGSRSGHIHRWDLERPDAEPAATWLALPDMVQEIAFSPDETSVFCSSRNDLIQRWQVDGPVMREAARVVGAGGLALSPTGDRLARINDGRLTLIDSSSLRDTRFVCDLPYFLMTFRPDGRVLAAATHEIVLVGVESGAILRRLSDPRIGPAHEARVSHLEYNRGGTLLLSASGDSDRKVKIWEPSSGRLLVTLSPGSTGPLDARFSPTADALAVACNRQVKLYRLDGTAEQTRIALHTMPLCDLAFSPDGRSLACLAARHEHKPHAAYRVTLWDLNDGRQRGRRTGTVRVFLEGVKGLPGPAFHPEDGHLALVRDDGRIERWDFPEGGEGDLLPASQARAFRYSPDGARLWAVVEDDRVQSWDGSTDKPATEWQNADADPSTLYSLAVGTQWVLVGGQDGVTRVLRATDGQLARTWQELPSPVRSVDLSPDETLAACGTDEGLAQVVRVPGGEVVAQWDDHGDRVEAVAFSPDGRLLATGSRDASVRLYVKDQDTFRRLLTLPSAQAPVIRVRFHPDGRTLAVLVQGETAVRVWHLDRLRSHLEAMNLGDAQWR